MAELDAKRDAILTAAMEVFANYGFRKTTMGDIIRAAGVSRATVYKYFGDKAEIFDSVVEREIGEMLAADRLAVEQAGTTRERLQAMVTTHAELIRKKINVLRVTKERFAEVVPHSASRIRMLTNEATALLVDIIEQGVRDGELSVEDAELTAKTMLYAFKGVFLSAMMDMWDADREQVVDRMVEMLMDGMRPRMESPE